jgi:hypothetical protein
MVSHGLCQNIMVSVCARCVHPGYRAWWYTIKHDNTDACTERKQTETMIYCHINTHIHQHFIIFIIFTYDLTRRTSAPWWWHIMCRNM